MIEGQHDFKALNYVRLRFLAGVIANAAPAFQGKCDFGGPGPDRYNIVAVMALNRDVIRGLDDYDSRWPETTAKTAQFRYGRRYPPAYPPDRQHGSPPRASNSAADPAS